MTNDESQSLLLVERLNPSLFIASPPSTISRPHPSSSTAQVVKVLRGLGSLEAWLESAELPAEEPEEGGRRAELEAEVAARLTDLRALRQEVDGLRGHGLPRKQSLQARMGRLEQK